MLKLIKENIPEILREKNNWVGFKLTEEGKKIPVDPNPSAFGEMAKINEPTTWGTFEQAVKLVDVGMCVAVGYALTKEENLIFIDIDYHADARASEEEKTDLEKKYNAMCRAVSYFQTYQEQSLSGDGVHLLAQGQLVEDLCLGQSKIMPIEIYNEGRFCIMTGHKLNEFGVDSSDRTVGGINNLHKNYFTSKVESVVLNGNKSLIPTVGQTFEDDKVLEVALRNQDFRLLWENKWELVKDKEGNQKYSQQHYSDFALIRKLTFYTANCPEQVNRIFRQSPCYQAYGQNGKWVKYESDIKKDIETASTTCTAVYTPKAIKTTDNTGESPSDITVVDSEIWFPDFKKINQLLYTNTDDKLIKNPVLLGIVQEYVMKYQNKEDTLYLPYLFKEDRNINGGTAIVRKRYGNRLKYSLNFNGYYIWDEKRYLDYGDYEILIHPITETLALVEHSVFRYVMTEVINADDTNIVVPAATPKESEKTLKDLLEEQSIKLFNESKRYVDYKLAKEILKKYKGMNVFDDLKGYYGDTYINMQNGVFDFMTRTLYPHSPIYNQHKITNCDFDPKAECPEFEAMMERLIPDVATRKELQKAFGLCLAKEQLPAKKVLMLLVGPKDSGKTTVLNAIVDVLGEYGKSVDNSLLMQNNKDKNKGPDMYDFRETLMITTSESNENDKLDTGRVKALTGETTISVKKNYATRMDKFTMIGIIFIDSNFKPYIPAKDTATWDRLRIIPFLFPVVNKDPDLKKKLVNERAGIFNWLLKGLDMVVAEKAVFETAAMLEMKEQYKKDVDTTEQFLIDCVAKVDDQYLRIPTSALFTTYKNWCKDNGFMSSIRNKFYEEISKVFEKKKSGIEYYINIKFTKLGNLYSVMGEKTPQEFAKQKRILLEGSRVDLPYSVLRATVFTKSKEWFFGVRKDTGEDSYSAYCSWCGEHILTPLVKDDFVAKINYIKGKQDSSGYSSNELIESAKDIWSNKVF